MVGREINKYAVATHSSVTSFITNFRQTHENVEAEVSAFLTALGQPIAMLSLMPGSAPPHDFSSSQSKTDEPVPHNNSVAFGLRVTHKALVPADWKLSKCTLPRMTFVPASCRPSVLRGAEIRETFS